MVKQVKIVSILMIINGALVVLMGILLTLMGPVLMTFMQRAQQQQGGPQMDKTAASAVTVVYVVLGILALVGGVLNILGGISGLKFRGRTLMLVALFANILALASCYCIPTSLGVMIYGLIVMFNPEVTRAFQMAAAGQDPLTPTAPPQ